jgi:hypothetical protein
MAVLSKNKGNNFERKTAKAFSARFSQYTGLTSAWRRDITSGSFFGKSNQSRLISHGSENANFGDLLGPENFKYSLECKHYKAPPSLNAIIKQDWKLLDEWISQAQQDAGNAGKIWMIVIKFNNIDEFVLIPELFGTLQSVFNYKKYFAVSLKAMFEQPDDYFFNEK